MLRFSLRAGDSVGLGFTVGQGWDALTQPGNSHSGETRFQYMDTFVLSGWSRFVGDARGWEKQRIWLCLLLIPWRGNQSSHGDEWTHRGLQATVCRSGPEKGGEESSPDQPIHAAGGRDEGTACQRHLKSVPACSWGLLRASSSTGGSAVRSCLFGTYLLTAAPTVHSGGGDGILDIGALECQSKDPSSKTRKDLLMGMHTQWQG